MERATLSSKIKKIIVVVVIVVFAVAGTFLINRGNNTNKTQNNNTSPAAAVVSTPKQKVEISKDKITYPGEDGKTALALLKANTKTITKSSSLGEYVESINGEDGGGKKYWLFYVNDKESQVGADAYKTHNSDIITWKLQ